MITTSPAKSKLASLPRNVWAVTLTSFLTDISSEMLVHLLPLFLFNVLGAKTNVIGLIEGVAETTASLLKVFSGWLSDVLGQRKWLAVAGYGLSTIAKPFLFVANTWEQVLVIRFGDRLGKGLRTAPRDALVADSVAEGQRGFAFGLHRAAPAFEGAIAVVNATSAGLAGEGQLDVPLEATLKTCVVMDMVYKPLVTPFLARARALDRRTVDGLAMLIGQAIPSFEAFYGQAPPADVDVRALALKILEAR